MGGGNSKTKASEKVDELEQSIDNQNNERYSSRQEVKRSIEKDKSKKNGRSKSVNNWNTIQHEETDIRKLERDYDTAINVQAVNISPNQRERKNSKVLKEFEEKRKEL